MGRQQSLRVDELQQELSQCDAEYAALRTEMTVLAGELVVSNDEIQHHRHQLPITSEWPMPGMPPSKPPPPRRGSNQPNLLREAPAVPVPEAATAAAERGEAEEAHTPHEGESVEFVGDTTLSS